MEDPSCAFALILTRSKLELLHVDFRKFVTEKWSLVDVGILFPLNILNTNIWKLTKFCICIGIDKI